MSKSSSKDKEKTFHEKLKQFFRLNKGAIQSGGLSKVTHEEFVLTAGIEKDIGPEAPLSHRVKAIKDLCDVVHSRRLEENAIETLWTLLKDLLQPQVSREQRHLALSFFRCLVQGQFEKLGFMRAHFFWVIKDHSIAEDLVPRLELLQALTENGKDILYFEEEIAPFLLLWMPEVIGAGKTQDFLALLVNVVKFNAAYLDQEVVSGLVQSICFLCCWNIAEDEVLQCLNVLDAIVCYSYLPSESLATFIGALCKTVNVEAYCQTSWKIMRNLLGTHLGHSGLYTMCCLLQDPNNLPDVALLRGAVFYVGMCLWGSKRVSSLRYSPTTVLASFLQALQCNHTLVVYEVTLSVQRLVNKYGLELQAPAWDRILAIIEEIITHTETYSQAADMSLICSHLHDTITSTEELMDLGQYSGSVKWLFEIVERCFASRPEASVLRLITQLSQELQRMQPYVLNNMNLLLDKYLKHETRTAVRLRVLEVLGEIINANRHIYEDDLLERLLIPHLQHIENEQNVAVRNAAVQLVADVCLECSTKKCLELLDILERIINKPFEHQASDTVHIVNESEVLDVKTAIAGLIRIFQVKLYQLPSIHAIRAYILLVNHLGAHYHKPVVFENSSTIRYMIFECLLQVRADKQYHLGLPDSGDPSKLSYSHYLVVDYKTEENVDTSSPPVTATPYPSCTVTSVSLVQGYMAVITCLKKEKDWKVLELILREVPQVMQNKALILSRHGSDIDHLADALCSMVSDRNLGLPETLRNAPTKFSRSDFHSYVFPVLTSLASYHKYLDSKRQQKLIKCLEFGLVSKCNCACIVALTVCTLEMKDTMYKLLPEVLLNLSKISAMVHIAIPILEFLSTFIRLPEVFASFVEDEYMSIFAIALPYTNPFKFNHYIVSLAHHVIAMWFLKCRLPFRKEFVKFITKGLRANVLLPFEEGNFIKSEVVNEDSSNRKRSSSLTEQFMRRKTTQADSAQFSRPEGRDRPGSGHQWSGEVRKSDMKPPLDEAMMAFHMELTETCIDLMARYTFATCSALPKRCPGAEFLLRGGLSNTWLLGNKLITVTTSGCGQKALKQGLCDKCWLLCKSEKGILSDIPDAEVNPCRRRHHSAVMRSVSNETPLLGPSAKDDLHMHSRLWRHTSEDSTFASSPPTEEVRRTLGYSPSTEPEASSLDKMLFGSEIKKKEDRHLCSCWCQGWAEIYIRRPTGDTSWVMRIQNQPHFLTSPQDFPLVDITSLFLPSVCNKDDGVFDHFGAVHRRIDSETLEETEYEAMLEHHFEPNSKLKTSETKSEKSPPPVQEDEGKIERQNSSNSSVGSQEEPRVGEGNKEEHARREGGPEELGEVDSEKDGEGRKIKSPVKHTKSSPETDANLRPSLLKDKAAPAEGRELKGQDGGGKTDGGLDSQNLVHKLSLKEPRLSCEATPKEHSALKKQPPCSSPPLETKKPATSQSPPSLRSKSSFSPPLFRPRSTGTPPGSQPASGNVSPRVEHHSPTENRTCSPTEFKPKEQNQSPQAKTPPCSPEVQQSARDGDGSSPDPSALPPLSFKRDRGYTISVMSPVRRNRLEPTVHRRSTPTGAQDTVKSSAINPSFVFLQFFHNAFFGSTSEKPLLLPNTEVMERAVKNLDRIPPYETHKIGVIYVGKGQANKETEILSNEFGSVRYAEFLQELGQLIKLKDVDRQTMYVGGLNVDGNDGQFAYIWQDDVMQVIFHVATMMPTREKDPSCNGKKLHIGNDYVTIVYNESGEDYNIQTIKGQFIYACVVIQPIDCDTNRVTIKAKPDLAEHFGHSDVKIVSDRNLAVLVRQLALHANLASMIFQSLQHEGRDPYASNWLERLRQIKRLRTKVLQEASGSSEETTSPETTSPRTSRQLGRIYDFAEYV